MRDDYVYHKGRMVKKRELPLSRRLARMALCPVRVIFHCLRRRHLKRWSISELERAKKSGYSDS